MSLSGFNESKKQKKSNTARVLHASHKPNKQITPNKSDTPRTQTTKNTQYKARRLNKSKQQARLKELRKEKKSSRIRYSSKHSTYIDNCPYPLWNPIYWPRIIYKRYASTPGPLQVQRPEVDTTAQNPSLDAPQVASDGVTYKRSGSQFKNNLSELKAFLLTTDRSVEQWMPNTACPHRYEQLPNERRIGGMDYFCVSWLPSIDRNGEVLFLVDKTDLDVLSLSNGV
ncbi:Protein of unknown function [Pyronema omphalodes CBS 100304]|uniref:Uncharacterized protein n=1 Tax=Pyronema omphalodes (strain CBS 100304) TaxID=1076935 RepID=U4L642_PYROM|nr:Protein of unknown function [Pyronema omphalodes CBS 100304]